jgi:hypothetical protein
MNTRLGFTLDGAASMRDLIDQRLVELRSELETGHRLQAELDARQDELRRSMLRISGAMQVLSELAAADNAQSEARHVTSHELHGDSPPPLRRVADA